MKSGGRWRTWVSATADHEENQGGPDSGPVARSTISSLHAGVADCPEKRTIRRTPPSACAPRPGPTSPACRRCRWCRSQAPPRRRPAAGSSRRASSHAPWSRHRRRPSPRACRPLHHAVVAHRTEHEHALGRQFLDLRVDDVELRTIGLEVHARHLDTAQHLQQTRRGFDGFGDVHVGHQRLLGGSGGRQDVDARDVLGLLAGGGLEHVDREQRLLLVDLGVEHGRAGEVLVRDGDQRVGRAGGLLGGGAQVDASFSAQHSGVPFGIAVLGSRIIQRRTERVGLGDGERGGADEGEQRSGQGLGTLVPSQFLHGCSLQRVGQRVQSIFTSTGLMGDSPQCFYCPAAHSFSQNEFFGLLPDQWIFRSIEWTVVTSDKVVFGGKPAGGQSRFIAVFTSKICGWILSMYRIKTSCQNIFLLSSLTRANTEENKENESIPVQKLTLCKEYWYYSTSENTHAINTQHHAMCFSFP